MNPEKIKVHYFNYHPRYDKWIDFRKPDQMDIIGSRSKGYGIGKSRLKKKSQPMTLTELAKSTFRSMQKYSR